MKTLWPDLFISSDQLNQQISLRDEHLYALAFPLSQEWKQQWVHNELKRQELIYLAPLFKAKQITPILLKGMALLDLIYIDHGSRFLCDIDLLVSPMQMQLAINLLLDQGYTTTYETKWWGNIHKIILNKQFPNYEIVIELHSKLFYHLNSTHKLETVPSSLEGFYQLSLEFLFVHLAGHLAFQHTYSKLYWLFDLYLLAQQYSNKINWNNVISIATELKLKRSVLQVIWILHQHFHLNLPLQLEKWSSPLQLSLWSILLNKKFLINPQINYFYYLIIKHITKDSLFVALSYDCRWLNTKIMTFPRNNKTN